MSNPKPKKAAKRAPRTKEEAWAVNMAAKEARASVSLDGDTHCCMACVQKIDHCCEKRPMSPDEAALVAEVVRAVEVNASSHTPYVQGLVRKIKEQR